MTSPAKVLVQPCPTPLAIPSYYNTQPHHTGKGFVSPWASAGKNDMIKFFRARLTDWQDTPLPAADALPAMRNCTWLPEGAGKEDSQKILFSWLGHAACHWRLPVPSLSSSQQEPRIITILTDPVFSKRCSPFQWLGPARFTDAPTSVQEMASSKVDNVWPDILVLSHNHYDHLDYDTVKQILSQPANKPKPYIFCPLGLATWFEKHLGIPKDGVTELDWWGERIVTLEGNRKIKLTCVPAQHFSGRSLTDRDQTLWAGWTFETLDEEGARSTQGKRVYFAGDTGYRTVPPNTTREEEEKLPTCPAFKEIGELLGPFDFSAIPIGAYNPRSFMSAIHVSDK
jgi:N-acyl-phosphatidylethanolamine-hydrolysing phospholipase D